MPKALEVCVDSFESAVAAITGGASRIELCSALTDGGLTPTPGLLIQIQKHNPNKIPIFCMVRCRPGNFVFTQEELEVMKEDTKILRKNGADGIVFGALTISGEVDMKKCREIITSAAPLPLTFHRAFDFVKRPTIEIEVLIDLGFSRVLTSGKQPTAQLGVKLIKLLMEQAEKRIIIVPGGGITVDNLKFIVENTGALEYHGSFKKEKEVIVVEEVAGDKIHVGDNESVLYVSDQALVAQAVHILKNE